MNYYGINRKMNVEAFIHKYKMTAQSGAITGDPFGKKGYVDELEGILNGKA